VSNHVQAPARVVTPAQTPSYENLSITFAAPARVEAGSRYAIVVSAPETPVAEATTGVAWKGDLGSSTRDPSGTPCADGAYAGGRLWVSNDALGADADFFFQTYVVPTRRVNVVKSGTGAGSVQDGTHAVVCGATCSAAFLQGETVTLTATPDADSIFTGWVGGGCLAPTPTCSFSVAADTTVTASFMRKTLTLSVLKAGSGTVTSVPAGIACGTRCRHRFLPGPLTLTAKPAPGWRFDRWRGSYRGTRPRCRLTLTKGESVSASFVRSAP
jgi:hypothetical protein